MSRIDAFLWRYAVCVTAAVMLCVTAAYVWTQDYLGALGALALLPFAVIFLVWPRVMNGAFQSGWMSGTLSYDEALHGLIDDTQRQLLFMASQMAMPTYHQHTKTVLQRVAELDELLKRRDEG